MPRVLIEAMAAGRPVIASRVGGIPHYIRDGETGLLFEREDVEGLTRALRQILGSREAAAQLAINGRDYVSRQLSDRCWVQDMRQTVEMALAG
jgi:glycosyltransferase involved in cell wall biosynthesis